MLVRGAVQIYVRQLEDSGRAKHTVRGYEADLRDLVQCASRSDGELTKAVVEAYMDVTSELAAATQARRLSALRGLLRSSGQADLFPDARRPVRGEQLTFARTASRADVEAVLGKIPRGADRDQLFFGLLARLGLRPGEALNLQVEDFDEAAESLSVPGWGGRRRRVFIDDRQVLLRLVNYIRAAGRSSGALFSAPGRDTPLRYQSMQHRWAEYCTAANVSVQLSELRRAHAEDLLIGGVPEQIVRDRLGQRTGPLTGRGVPASVEDGDDALRAWQNRAAAEPRRTDTDDVRRDQAG